MYLVMMSSYWHSGSPKFTMTRVLSGSQREKKEPGEGVVMMQAGMKAVCLMPRNANNFWQPPRGPSPLSLQREHGLANTQIRASSSRTVEEHTRLWKNTLDCLSLPANPGNLLQKLQVPKILTENLETAVTLESQEH